MSVLADVSEEHPFFSVVNGDYGNPTLYYERLP